MNNATRQRLMNLNRELQYERRSINTVSTALNKKTLELLLKQRRNRADNTTLRHVQNKRLKLGRKSRLLREDPRHEELATLRRNVWNKTHPGQPYTLRNFTRWYNQDKKKYEARVALRITNLPKNMRELISKLV
jgi:hypothetical protein